MLFLGPPNLKLQHTYNLSKSLQSETISAAEGQEIANHSVKVLKSCRNDHSFDTFWMSLQSKKEQYDISEPELKRKKKRPSRIEDNNTHYFPSSPVDMYRAIYNQALDDVTNGIESRFNQQDWKTFVNLQTTLFEACKSGNYENELDQICSLYKEDLSKDLLKVQLQYLSGYEGAQDIKNIKDLINWLS